MRGEVIPDSATAHVIKETGFKESSRAGRGRASEFIKNMKESGLATSQQQPSSPVAVAGELQYHCQNTV